MKYLISFGPDGSAVVSGSIEDLGDLINQAVAYGAGDIYTKQEMVEDFISSEGRQPRDDDELYDFICDISLEPVDDPRYDEECFVDVNYLNWMPVPPNTKLGLVERGELEHTRYRSGLR